MSRQKRQQELVGRLYDASLDDTLWPDVGAAIAGAFDSTSATLQTRSGDGARILFTTENVAAASYEAHYCNIDPWFSGAAASMNRIFVGTDLIDEATLLKSEYYTDWASQCDILHIIGSVLEVTQSQIAGLGIHRGPRHPGFTTLDRREIGTFTKHIQRALRLQHQLGAPSRHQQWTLEALTAVQAHFFVVDEACRIHFASPQATSHCEPEAAFRVLAGRLLPRAAHRQQSFAQMVRAAVKTARGEGGDAPEALALERADGRPVAVSILPLRALPDSPERALVFVQDAREERDRSKTLQQLYGLTPTEALVASDLSRGLSPAQIAESRMMGLNTAKTHVRKVLAKTQTRRQSEFVALALRIPV